MSKQTNKSLFKHEVFDVCNVLYSKYSVNIV